MTKPVIKTISQVIAEHTDDPQNPNGGGVLATCTCGTPYDWMPDHLQDMILRDCFPHLAQVHQELISKEVGLITKQFLRKQYLAYESQQDDLREWAHEDPQDHMLLPFRNDDWMKGYTEAQEELRDILDRHDL